MFSIQIPTVFCFEILLFYQKTYCYEIFQLEERKESSQSSSLERQTSKEDSAEEEHTTKKLVENLSPKIEEKSNLIENDESTVRYIQVRCCCCCWML